MKTLNRPMAWLAARALFISIGAMCTVAYVAAMQRWLIALGIFIAAVAWTLLYKMLCEWEVRHGNTAAEANNTDRSYRRGDRRGVIVDRVSGGREEPSQGDEGPSRTEIRDAISAVRNLGYSRAAATLAIQNASASVDPSKFDLLVKTALADLTMRRVS